MSFVPFAVCLNMLLCNLNVNIREISINSKNDVLISMNYELNKFFRYNSLILKSIEVTKSIKNGFVSKKNLVFKLQFFNHIML